MISGFALIDKDPGWTSHDVVGRLRRLYGQKRVGHAGTLDPMATGVLVVGLGEATRLLRFVQGLPKVYEATIRLGAGTLTDDAEGEILTEPGWQWDPAGLSAAVVGLTGDILQVPSAVSAIKVDGQRSYARVRKGEQVELQPRPVRIERFEVLGAPRQAGRCTDIDVVVECSSGTYIRALARDLGAALGSAGHLTSLRRTAIGPIPVAVCERLGEVPPAVTETSTMMAKILPVTTVDEADARAVRNGLPPAMEEGVRLILDESGEWVSVVQTTTGRTSILVNRPT